MEFSVLIVESDHARRQRLNAACSNSARFKHVYQNRSYDDVLESIKDLPPVDICFFSNKLPTEDFKKLSATFVDRRLDRGTAYVYVGEHKGDYLNQGFHAFIEDPFSVESLHQIVDIACSVREQYKRQDLDAGLSTILKDLIAHVRLMGHLSSIGTFTNAHLDNFRHIARKLEELSDTEVERYLDLLTETFAKEPPPVNLPETLLYNGVSQRVRQLIESRIFQICSSSPS